MAPLQGNVVNLRILQGAVRYFSVGAATSRPKTFGTELPNEWHKPVGFTSQPGMQNPSGCGRLVAAPTGKSLS